MHAFLFCSILGLFETLQQMRTVLSGRVGCPGSENKRALTLGESESIIG